MHVLFSGQQVIKLPDGRLQLISAVPQKVASPGAGQVVTPTLTAQPRPAIQIQGSKAEVRPQTVVVNSAGVPVSLPTSMGVTPTKIVMGSQPGGTAIIVSSQQMVSNPGTMSIMTSAGPGIARIISPMKGSAGQVIQKVVSGGSIMAVTNTPQGPRLIRQTSPQQIVVQTAQSSAVNLQLKQQQLQAQQAIIAQQQATLQAASQAQPQVFTAILSYCLFFCLPVCFPVSNFSYKTKHSLFLHLPCSCLRIVSVNIFSSCSL